MSDIRKVIEHYLPLSESSGLLEACCPFHDEDTPSFKVHEDTQSWYCYGQCSKGGDVYSFVQDKEDCDFKEAKVKIAEILGVDEYEKSESSSKSKKKVQLITEEQMSNFKKGKTIQRVGYRGIKPETDKFYGHASKVVDGKVVARWYPEYYMINQDTNETKLAGYKCRNHPKDFSYGKIGHTGVSCMLSGQNKYKGADKRILIVGGEEDKGASHQMLMDHLRERNQDSYNPIPVVSPTTGEGSAAKQLANNYFFLDRYDEILIGMDNDAAGREATKKIIEALPKEKLKVVTWSGKDPNKMLLDGQHKQFVRDFYNAKPVIKSSIMSSSDLLGLVGEVLLTPRITLPDYMHRVQTMTGGGFRQGSIINLIGDTSVGKTTHINNIVYHILFNAPEKPGVVSLEATGGEYAIDMLSLHLEKNLLRFKDGAQDVVDYLNDPDVQEAYADLFTNEYGEPRFALLDERDGDVNELEKQINLLITVHGCRIIIVDVLSDLVRSLSREETDNHMAWQKRLVKSGVTIINVMHTRKPSGSDGELRKVTEYDILGSSSQPQSAAYNLVINRDKMADSEMEKNITHVDLNKCRNGDTGPAGQWYYDKVTRQCYDFNDYFGSDWGDYEHEEKEVKGEVVESTPFVSHTGEVVDISTKEVKFNSE
jgi:archaellum biogenesis ATPase FlaH